MQKMRALQKMSTAVVLLSLTLSACAELRPAKSREGSMVDTKRVNQSELQDDLQRLSGTFVDRLRQATESIIPSLSNEQRLELQRQGLAYGATVVDIVSAPNPEVNLLDMMAFVMLAEKSVREHWIPVVFGEAAEPLVAVFADTSRDLAHVAAKVMSPRQIDLVRATVDDWRRENPQLVHVAAVRMGSFSSLAGEIAEDRARQSRGLLSAVKSATQSADQALLAADRAIFLAQRMPFLLRLQARVGTQELLRDSVSTLSEADDLIERTSELRPLLTESVTLAEKSQQAAAEANDLMRSVQPLLEVATDEKPHTGLERVLESANRLTDKSLKLLDEARPLLPKEPDAAVAGATSALDGLVRRWLLIAALFGSGLIILFWGGYVVAKRFTADHGSRPSPPEVTTSSRPANAAPPLVMWGRKSTGRR